MPQPPFRKKAKIAGKEHPIRRTVRTNLRNRRLEQGITQKELGEATGTGQTWVQQLERPGGDEVPNLYMLFDIAVQLACSPADLLTPGRFKGDADADEDLRGKRRVVKANFALLLRDLREVSSIKELRAMLDSAHPTSPTHKAIEQVLVERGKRRVR